MRSLWNGQVIVGQVCLGVQAWPMVVEKKEIELVSVHAGCGRKPTTRTECPEHGVLTREELARAVEVQPGQFLELAAADLEAAREAPPGFQALASGTVPPPECLRKNYWLLPHGPGSDRIYAWLVQVLGGRALLGTMPWYGREILAAIHGQGPLVLSLVHGQAEVVPPPPWAPAGGDCSREEIRLGKALIDHLAGRDSPLDSWRDPYPERIQAIIASRLAGKHPERGQPASLPPVRTLAEAIAASLPRPRPGRRRTA